MNEQHRIALPVGSTSHRQEGYPTGAVLGNYFYLENKASGVEPGFLATFIDDDFCEQLSGILLREEQTNTVLRGLGEMLKPNLASGETTRADKLKQWLRKNPQQAENLANLCKKNKNIKRYLIKQDYTDPNLFGRVTIPVSRAANSNAVKKLVSRISGAITKVFSWFGIKSPFSEESIRKVVATVYSFVRNRPTAEENRNALLECIGNDITSKAHGMQCQEQTVIFGTYPDGKLKILTRGTWDFGIEPLGEVHGGDQKSGNYLSIDVGTKDQPSHLADDSVKDLGERFALMLTQGDVDAIGSRAQNKFKKDGKLFGLDFGQVYRGRNDAIANLNDDFSFRQMGHVLKNFSIFENTPLREKMKGIHCIRRLLGEKIPEEILAEYGPEFRKKIDEIKPGRDTEIFDGYIQQLERLSAEATRTKNSSLAAEYNALIKEIKSTKENAKKTNAAVVEKFRGRLSLTPTQLDILEAFEKLSSETSLTSPDGTVLLNHMRVNKRVKCEMKVQDGICTLTLGTPRDSKKAQDKLKKYINSHPEFKALIDAGIIRINNGTIQFKKTDAKKVTEVFNEATVQEHKHPEDVSRRKKLETQLKNQTVARLNELTSSPEWRLQDGNIVLPLKEVDRNEISAELKHLNIAFSEKKTDSGETYLVLTSDNKRLSTITEFVNKARKEGRAAVFPSIARQQPIAPISSPPLSVPTPREDVTRGSLQTPVLPPPPLSPPKRTAPSPPPSRIELSIVHPSDPQPCLSENETLGKLQESFKRHNTNDSGVVLQRPEQLFARSLNSDPKAIKISIKNYDLIIDRYDAKAIELGIRMLCDVVPNIKPKDIQIAGAGLTEEQRTTFGQIQQEIGRDLKKAKEATRHTERSMVQPK